MPRGTYIRTPAIRAKTSATMNRPEVKAKQRAALIGRRLTVEHCAALSAAHAGVKLSPKHCAAISAALKIALNRPGVQTRHSASISGPKHYNWMGGISNLPYDWEFNNELREEVRRRDRYRCQFCGTPQVECEEKLLVHHLDYDKKNSDPVNLVSLCRSCHGRTNANREHWMAVFRAMAVQRTLKEGVQ